MTEVSVLLGGRRVSSIDPCYVIAEIGVNHDGNPDIAHQMIDAARRAGADAVKFQTFRAEDLVRADSPKARYQEQTTGGGTQLEMLKALELPQSVYEELRDHCRASGIDFMSTAFEARSLEDVVSLDPVCLKWPSGELDNIPLLRRAAKARLPVLLSTGMGSLVEIAAAIDELSRNGCDDIVILQCVSSYPAQIKDQNLRTIRTMAEVFGRPVGFSDHTVGPYAAIAARSLGMAILEKHFTLDRQGDGPDHSTSMEPAEFSEMIGILRQVEEGLGDGVKRPLHVEQDVKLVARKSLVAVCDLSIGHIVSDMDLTAKRPSGGIPPNQIDAVVGRRITKPLQAGDALSFNHLS